jgi:hypothetical protein
MNRPQQPHQKENKNKPVSQESSQQRNAAEKPAAPAHKDPEPPRPGRHPHAQIDESGADIGEGI